MSNNDQVDLQMMRELDFNNLQDHLMIYVKRLYKHYMMKPVSERPLSLQAISQVECYDRRWLESIRAAEDPEFKQEAVNERNNFICICYQWNDEIDAPDEQEFELLPELLQFEDKICCLDYQVEKTVDFAKLPAPLVPLGHWCVTPYSEYDITTDSCDHFEYTQLKDLNFCLDSHLRNYIGRLYSYFMRREKEDRPACIQNLSSISIFKASDFLKFWFSETECAQLDGKEKNATVLLYEFLSDTTNRTFDLFPELLPFKDRIKCIRGSLFPKDDEKQLTRAEVLQAFPHFVIRLIEPVQALLRQ